MYYETSAKTGQNIDECFYFIAEKLVKEFENKENEEEKRTDLINNDNLKEGTVDLIGNKKCCLK